MSCFITKRLKKIPPFYIYRTIKYSMVQDILWKVHSYSACQKISYFLYGTRRFITVFTKARHWTLSWASRIQFAPSIPISLRSTTIKTCDLQDHSIPPTSRHIKHITYIRNISKCKIFWDFHIQYVHNTEYFLFNAVCFNPELLGWQNLRSYDGLGMCLCGIKGKR